MSTDAIRHHLFRIIALLSYNKLGCSNLGLAEDPAQGSQQTNEWKILEQLLNPGCTIENCLVFNLRLILLCTAVFFNIFLFHNKKFVNSGNHKYVPILWLNCGLTAINAPYYIDFHKYLQYTNVSNDDEKHEYQIRISVCRN